MYRMGLGNVVVELVRRADKNKVDFAKGLANKQRAASDLYLVECTTRLIEGSTLPVPTTGFGAREVTLIYMSFTSVNVLIALPGGSVTFVGPW